MENRASLTFRISSKLGSSNDFLIVSIRADEFQFVFYVTFYLVAQNLRTSHKSLSHKLSHKFSPPQAKFFENVFFLNVLER